MHDLNEQFGIPGVVKIEPGHGGLTKVIVTTPRASAEIYLHGAHVTHFQPAGQKPVIWLSQSSWFDAAKPIRGGVPICFPWFGPKKDDPKAPAHGFARLREWDLQAVAHVGDEVSVTLSLQSDESTRQLWPFDFTARHIIKISSALEMRLEVKNETREKIRFEQAQHTYLVVGDVKQISIDGLAGTQFIDKVDGAKQKQQTDPQIRFTGETDRVYQDTQATCVVNDPALNRKIEISKSGSDATVIWNPWINKAKAMADFGDDEWPGMVCVETVNVAKNAVELAAGASHAMIAKVEVR